jgi:hypothetical protein
MRVIIQKGRRRHHHAGRAKPTLETMLLPEPFLNGVQRSILLQPLDCGDLSPIRLDRKEATGLDGLTIEVDGTGATVTGLASDVGAGQAQDIAEAVDQE